MFERTFSFWRRLVGRDAPPQEQGDERRLWVRFPADLPTTIQPTSGPDKERLPAKIKDISLGGAYIVAERRLDPGQLITIELPDAERDVAKTVLACIVRAEEKAKGTFALGCVFSQDLAEEDLQGLGASRVKAEDSDKRTWQRFNTTLRAEFEKIGVAGNAVYSAQVLNISPTGVGLVSEQNIEAGALLTLRLLGHEGKVCRTILSCVVHVTPQPPGEWKLGCNFVRQLDEADLRALI